MFAVVEIAGFQEKVAKGDTIHVPLQEGEKGAKLTFDNVLMVVADSGDMTLGSPFVKGAKVEAEVVEHGRDDKVRVFRFRRRKRFMKSRGHRQHYTAIKITNIAA